MKTDSGGANAKDCFEYNITAGPDAHPMGVCLLGGPGVDLFPSQSPTMSAAVDPKDYRLNDEQKHVRASCVAMFAVSVVFVALRCFVRTRLQLQFSSDDWLLLAGLVGEGRFRVENHHSADLGQAGYLAMTIMIVFSINEGGFGRKTAELSIQTFYTGAKVYAPRSKAET